MKSQLQIKVYGHIFKQFNRWHKIYNFLKTRSGKMRTGHFFLIDLFLEF